MNKREGVESAKFSFTIISTVGEMKAKVFGGPRLETHVTARSYYHVVGKVTHVPNSSSAWGTIVTIIKIIK